MSDQVWQFIMGAGFRPREQATEVSGRGVGMDVVKKNISAMGGRSNRIDDRRRHPHHRAPAVDPGDSTA